ncbi:PAM68 family protein, partial [Candidatus Marsarchaeota archaeon]|nr:PAM68 family protein [Candidatus Marsarchaeota archaeon]
MVEKKKKASIWYTITNISELSRKEYIKLIRRVALFVGIGFIASFIVFFVIAVLGGLSNVIQTIESANPYLYLLAYV